MSKLEFKPSQGFASWLDGINGSLIFTARRLGKVISVGTNTKGEVTYFDRTFPEPRGLFVQGKSLFMGDYFRIWRFENALTPEVKHPFEGHDAAYIPEMMYRTGNMDSHEIGVLKNGMVAFASTRMNCIAGCSASHAMVPLWKPSFISGIHYDDRCHLNGLAIEDGAVKYATALSETDTHEGWRDVRADGGVLLDVKSGKAVAKGLSMPHSPRLHDGELWVLNSGKGEVGVVDRKTGTFEARAFVPGFARGMVFVGDYIITTTSKLRESKSFQSLPLETILDDKNLEDVCGLHIINRKSGEVEHNLTIDGMIEEIYDTAFISGAKNIMLGGLKDDLSSQFITIAPVKH